MGEAGPQTLNREPDTSWSPGPNPARSTRGALLQTARAPASGRLTCHTTGQPGRTLNPKPVHTQLHGATWPPPAAP